MPMSEDEVRDMEKRVEADMEVDLTCEVQWTQAQLDLHKKAENENVLAFRLHKRLRHDEAMKQNETSLVEIRKVIKYCRERLEELSEK